jgi:hypothetical protein
MSAPTMAASQFSELDDKIKAVIEQMHENAKIINEKQQAMDKVKEEIVNMRFRDLTDKLGSAVDMVKKEASKGQVQLQMAMESPQTQLNQLSGIIQGWMKPQQGEKSVGYVSPPARKKQNQNQEDESMDKSPSSQVQHSYKNQ